MKGEQSEKDEIQNMMNINKMMVDIENEYDEIDSLLREVDSLTISTGLGKPEEAMINRPSD